MVIHANRHSEKLWSADPFSSSTLDLNPIVQQSSDLSEKSPAGGSLKTQSSPDLLNACYKLLPRTGSSVKARHEGGAQPGRSPGSPPQAQALTAPVKQAVTAA
jgi:hypothetical protein